MSLLVSSGTVNSDLSYLRQQAKSNIRRYIDERLPEEYEKCLVGFTTILREACKLHSSQMKREKKYKLYRARLSNE
jgi:hypothetical protein